MREFSQTTKTSQQAADALGWDVGALAGAAVGRAARQATPDEVRAATGFPIGGVSPVGWPTPQRAFIDESLAEYDEIWSAAGTPNAVFPTTYDELVRLTGAAPLQLG